MTLRLWKFLSVLALFGASAMRAGFPEGAGFTEHLIANDFRYPYGVSAGDIDRDGDIDVTTSDCTTRGSREQNDLRWFENTGSGNFRPHYIWKEDRAGRYERHRLADINRDGWLDAVIVDNAHHSVLWFENNRAPASGALFKKHVIAEGTVNYAYDVDVGDFDGDGRLDVAAIAGWREGQEIAWFESGTAPDGPWTKRVIDQGLGETRAVLAADVDGDRDLDIVATWARKGWVVWYANPGKPRTLSWKRHMIDTAGRPVHGQAVDFDGDGDIDVLMSLGMGAGIVPSDVDNVAHQIVWYENVGKRGKGSEWRKHVLADSFDQAFDAVAADLDGDGRLDVAATGWGKSGRLAWLRNPGPNGGKWNLDLLKSPWPNAVQVITADLDGDRRPDVIAAAEDGVHEVRWWRSLGVRPRPGR
jgi:FG-GAP-like repeat